MLKKVIMLWHLLSYLYVDRDTICIQIGASKVVVSSNGVSVETAGNITLNGESVYLNCDSSYIEEHRVEVCQEQRKSLTEAWNLEIAKKGGD